VHEERGEEWFDRKKRERTMDARGSFEVTLTPQAPDDR